MQCKGHVNKVRCIDWYEDDMGFASCGIDGNAYQYELIKMKEEGGTRDNSHDVNIKGVQFTGLCNIPNKKNEILLVGTDRKIHYVSDANGKSACDVEAMVSQVNILHNGKAFFAAIGENSRPGAIQIWKFLPRDDSSGEDKPYLDKIATVQAHSKGIERMRLTFDNNWLFTAGKDGCLIIHKVDDRDVRGGVKHRERDAASNMQFSDEI
jgi:WD40 repeat protein